MYKKNKGSKYHKSIMFGMLILAILGVLMIVHTFVANYYPHVVNEVFLEKLFWFTEALLVPALAFIGYGGWNLSENQPDLRRLQKIFGLISIVSLSLIGIIVVVFVFFIK